MLEVLILRTSFVILTSQKLNANDPIEESVAES